MSIKRPFGYLYPGDYYKIEEHTFHPIEATKLGMVPLSLPCRPSESWIIRNMMIDCQRNHLNYCFVQEGKQISIWKATNTKQPKGL